MFYVSVYVFCALCANVCVNVLALTRASILYTKFFFLNKKDSNDLVIVVSKFQIPSSRYRPDKQTSKKTNHKANKKTNKLSEKAEKTEVLSEEHVKVEKRLENVKVVSHAVVKKLQGCMRGPTGIDNDKRLKRLPLILLAASLSEGYSSLEDVPLGKVLQICGETEFNLGLVLSQFETQLESDVLEPLLILAEEYIPNIQKQRKHLAKLVLDMDSAKNRYSQAAKAMSSGTSALTTAKLESLREEMEDAENKVELGKDQLATELFQFAIKEEEHTQFFIALLEAQAEYHRKSLEILDKTLPRAKKEQENCIKPCYGLELERHLSITNREIAFPIEASVVALLETGLQEEGLFRIAAANSKLRKLKAGLDCCMVETDVLNDPHAFAGALKSYLRELPEPLMTFQLFNEWIQASYITDNQEKLQYLWTICDKLPKANKDNFRYLIKFLAKLAEHHEVNKMSPSNISIVLGPNLLWAPSEGSADVMSSMSIQVVGIVETILQYADWFFHNDVEFDQTAIYSMAPQASQVLPSTSGSGHTHSTSSSLDQENGEQRGTDMNRLLRPASVATDVDLSREMQRKDGPNRLSIKRMPPPIAPRRTSLGGCSFTGVKSLPEGSDILVHVTDGHNVYDPTCSSLTFPSHPSQVSLGRSQSVHSQEAASSNKMNASPAMARKGAGGNVNSVSPNVTHKGLKKPAPAPPKASGSTLTSLVQSTTPGVEHLSISSMQHDTPHYQPGHQSSVLILPASPGTPEAPSSSPKARPHSQSDMPSLSPGKPSAQDVKAATTAIKPPVPKPRVRPTMPPPPQPSSTSPGDMSDDSCEEISTVTADEEDSPTLPEVFTEKPKHAMSMEELDSESTAF
uniref:rho GTPase-activating protein 44-like isoform X3 n=1 Tax=Myxine glutinosa TaxID=7769 RepID=UPI00358DE35E